MNRIIVVYRFFILILGIQLLASSCSIKKKVLTTNRPQHLDKIPEKNLEAMLHKNEVHYEWIAAKFSADVTIDSSLTSFSVSFRGRKDSVLWVSITAPIIGIEVARGIITKDSIKFIERIHSRYFVGDFSTINKVLHTDLDFELLQNLLVGNSAEFYDDDDRLHGGTSDGRYFLSTIRKRKVRKVMDRNKELKDPAQIIWMEPTTYKVARIVYKEFNQNRTFDADFDKFLPIDSMLFPRELHFNIKAEKTVDVKLNYSKITINTPQQFPFSISSKYEPIVYKEKQQ